MIIGTPWLQADRLEAVSLCAIHLERLLPGVATEIRRVNVLPAFSQEQRGLQGQDASRVLLETFEKQTADWR